MDMQGLNDRQRDAVMCTSGPLIVFAGAGSGKTRVLTSRIAHLVGDCGVDPDEILAITFTNKAANEMRDRLLSMVPDSYGMWVMTFHRLCLRMLTGNETRVGYRPRFVIADDSDQRTIARRIIKDATDDAYDDSGVDALKPAEALEYVSRQKSRMRDVEDLDRTSETEAPYIEFYARYRDELMRANAMDFDDLLLNAYRLLKENPAVLSVWQSRFRHISVDEYQDTNRPQYEIVRLLAEGLALGVPDPSTSLMVVGDDDQSIYSWRGADYTNILHFTRDWSNATVVRLEANYRSGSEIVDAATRLVSNNTRRAKKTLFSATGSDSTVDIVRTDDARDEADYVRRQVKRLHDGGVPYNYIAVLYRVNALSRPVEDAMVRARVPYRIVRGLRFFDRKEVKDVIAYLRVAISPDDDIAFARIVNTPARGLGEQAMRLFRKRQGRDRCSLEAAVRAEIAAGTLKGKRLHGAQSLVAVVDGMRGAMAKGRAADVAEYVVEKSGLGDAVGDEDDGDSRLANIDELVEVLHEFEADPPDDAFTVEYDPDTGVVEEVPLGDDAPADAIIRAFIEQVALDSSADEMGDDGDAVTLMTVHAAKGLEFAHVFVIGFEEGILPWQVSAPPTDFELENNPALRNRLEEERRLAYVAMTRAERTLTLTRTDSRVLYGQVRNMPLSQFANEAGLASDDD